MIFSWTVVFRVEDTRRSLLDELLEYRKHEQTYHVVIDGIHIYASPARASMADGVFEEVVNVLRLMPLNIYCLILRIAI